MNILSFDQSSAKTGYAYFENNDLIQYGLIDCSSNKKNKEDNHTGLEAMMKEIGDTITHFHPDIVIMEDTIMQSNAVTLKKLAKLQGMIIYKCYIDNIKLEVSFPAHWRKELGMSQTKDGKKLKRPQLKQLALNYVKDTFEIDVSEDVADAICIGEAYINEINKEK